MRLLQQLAVVTCSLIVFVSAAAFGSQAAYIPPSVTNTFAATLEITTIVTNSTTGGTSTNGTQQFTIFGDVQGAVVLQYRRATGYESRFFLGSGTTYEVTPAGGCVTGSLNSSPDATTAKFLSTLFTSLPTLNFVHTGTAASRGITLDQWHAQLTTLGALPVTGSVSGALPTSFSCDIFFTSTNWQSDFETIVPEPKLVNLVGASGTSIQQTTNISVIWFGHDVVSPAMFLPPTACVPAPPSGAPTPAPTTAVANPMPTFPDAFSADIETTMIDQELTFSIYTAFSSVDRFSITTIRWPYADTIGRQLTRSAIVVGNTRTAYDYVNLSVPLGLSSPINDGVRNYFWPDSIACSQVAFGVDLISGSVSALLLATSQPAYMGQVSVRGIPCDYWESSSPSMRVQWFWAQQWWGFENGLSRPLVRIIIQGTGQSPLFVHHPFFQQGTVVPSNIAQQACATFLTSDDPQCAIGTDSLFHHVHDFLSFTPSVPPIDEIIPSACASPSATYAIPESASCGSVVTSAGLAVIIVFVAALSAVAGACCMWCRLSKMPVGQPPDIVIRGQV